mgnify:CR=1 FL=1
MTNPNKDYHGSTMYVPEWSTPHDLRNWMDRQLFEGEVLNVCAGKSPLGNVTVDVDAEHDPDVVADVRDLPFKTNAFDTVYVDPPYSLYSFQGGYWPREALRVARKRLVLQCPGKRVTLPRTAKKWYLAEPKPGSSSMAVKLFQVFEPAGQPFDLNADGYTVTDGGAETDGR